MAAGAVPVVVRYGACLAERGNWQNVMGATLSALSEKRKKKIQKKKSHLEKYKNAAKKILSAGDTVLTSTILPVFWVAQRCQL